LPLSVHEAVFVFVLKLAAEQKLLSGKTVAVDSTMLEADAAIDQAPDFSADVHMRNWLPELVP
jgi:hypothetical protein